MRSKANTEKNGLTKLQPPAPLLEQSQFMVWRPIQKNGRVQRPPFPANSPRSYVDFTDPQHWADHATAKAVGSAVPAHRPPCPGLPVIREPGSAPAEAGWHQRWALPGKEQLLTGRGLVTAEPTVVDHTRDRHSLGPRFEREAATLAGLTGWDMASIRAKMQASGQIAK